MRLAQCRKQLRAASGTCRLPQERPYERMPLPAKIDGLAMEPCRFCQRSPPVLPTRAAGRATCAGAIDGGSKAVSQKDRLRRVVLLCAGFTRNLAYFRAGQEKEGQPLLQERAPFASFWRQVNGNALDVAVLDWCKLFADRTGEHHWAKVVKNRGAFETGLLRHLGVNATSFEDYVKEMRSWRNKFVAHADPEKIAQIPDMAPAKSAAEFLLEHITANEAAPGDLDGRDGATVKAGYDTWVAEARELLSRHRH